MPKNTLLQRIGSAIDYPVEQMGGKTIIEIIDNCIVTIENHKGVIGYSNEIIRVKSKLGHICIKGACLRLDKICRDQLCVRGTICSVEILGRG